MQGDGRGPAYKEHHAGAVIGELRGQAVERHARRADSVNKEHFVPLLGTELVHADRAVLVSPVSAAGVLLHVFFGPSLLLRTMKEGRVGAHRRVDVSAPQERIRMIHQVLELATFDVVFLAGGLLRGC